MGNAKQSKKQSGQYRVVSEMKSDKTPPTPRRETSREKGTKPSKRPPLR